jgi:hypothetical protein
MSSQNLYLYGLFALNVTNSAIIKQNILPYNTDTLKKILEPLKRIDLYLFDIDCAAKKKIELATKEVINLTNVRLSFYAYSLTFAEMFVPLKVFTVSVVENFEELVNKMYIYTFVSLLYILAGPPSTQKTLFHKILTNLCVLPDSPPENLSTTEWSTYSNFVSQVCLAIFQEEVYNRVQVINYTYLHLNTLEGILHNGTLSNNTLRGAIQNNATIQNGTLLNNTVNGLIQNNATIQNGTLLNNTLNGLLQNNATIQNGTLLNNTLNGLLQNNATIQNGTLLNNTLNGLLQNNATIQNGTLLDNTLNGLLQNNATIQNGTLLDNTLNGLLQNNATIQNGTLLDNTLNGLIQNNATIQNGTLLNNTLNGLIQNNATIQNGTLLNNTLNGLIQNNATIQNGTLLNNTLNGLLQNNATIQNGTFLNNTLNGLLQNNATIQNGTLLNNTLNGLLQNNATIQNGTLLDNTLNGRLQNNATIQNGTLLNNTLNGLLQNNATIQNGTFLNNTLMGLIYNAGTIQHGINILSEEDNFTLNSSISDGFNFGYSIASNSTGELIVVGDAASVGRAIIYDKENTTWIKRVQIDGIQEIPGVDGELSEEGTTVAINGCGSLIASGAPAYGSQPDPVDDYYGSPIFLNKGMARLFTYNGTSVSEVLRIVGSQNDNVGTCVSLSYDGVFFAVGAPGYSNNTGYVKIYKNSNGSWDLISTLFGVTSGNKFGSSISFSGDGSILVVGAPGGDFVTVFALQNDSYTLSATLSASSIGSFYGSAVEVSLDGLLIVIGASFYDSSSSNSGKIILYSFLNNQTSYLTEFVGIGTDTKSGNSLSVSRDKNYILVGGEKNAYLLKNTGGVLSIVNIITSLKRSPVGNSVFFAKDSNIFFVSSKINNTVSSVFSYENTSVGGTLTGNVLSGILQNSGTIQNGTILNTTLMGFLNNDNGSILGGTLSNNTLRGVIQNNATIQNGTFLNNTLNGLIQNNATIQNGTLLNNTLNGLLQNNATIQNGTLLDNTLNGLLQNNATIQNGTLLNTTLVGFLDNNNGSILGGTLSNNTLRGVIQNNATIQNGTLLNTTMVGTISNHGANIIGGTIEGTTITGSITSNNSTFNRLLINDNSSSDILRVQYGSITQLNVNSQGLTAPTIYVNSLNVLGSVTNYETYVKVTDQLLIENAGTAPTLKVNQSNTTLQPIAEFFDDNVRIVYIDDFGLQGNVGTLTISGMINNNSGIMIGGTISNHTFLGFLNNNSGSILGGTLSNNTLVGVIQNSATIQNGTLLDNTLNGLIQNNATIQNGTLLDNTLNGLIQNNATIQNGTLLDNTLNGLIQNNATIQNGTLLNTTLVGFLNNNNGSILGGTLSNNTLMGTIQNSATIQNGTFTNNALLGFLNNYSGSILGGTLSSNTLIGQIQNSGTIQNGTFINNTLVGFLNNENGSILGGTLSNNTVVGLLRNSGTIYNGISLLGEVENISPSSTITGSDTFGYSNALNATGDILVVGEPEGEASGSIIVYRKESGTWTHKITITGEQEASLNGEGEASGEGTAVSVSGSGTLIATGAPGYGGSIEEVGEEEEKQEAVVQLNKGMARLFTFDGTIESEVLRVVGEEGDNLGTCVILSHDGVCFAVGAPGYDEDRGYVKVFKNINGTWSLLLTLNGTADSSDAFGSSISFSENGSFLAIGAPGGNYVKVYSFQNDSYIESATISGSDDFGSSVEISLDGSVIIVGSPGYDSNKGKITVYTFLNNQTTQFAEYLGDSGEIGKSVSMSRDTKYILAGGIEDVCVLKNLNTVVSLLDKVTLLEVGKSVSYARDSNIFVISGKTSVSVGSAILLDITLGAPAILDGNTLSGILQNNGTILNGTFSNGSFLNGSFSNNTIVGFLNNNSGSILGGTLSNSTLVGAIKNGGSILGGTLSNSTLIGTIENSGNISGGTLSSSTLIGEIQNNGTINGGRMLVDSGAISGTLTTSTLLSDTISAQNSGILILSGEVNANTLTGTTINNIYNTLSILDERITDNVGGGGGGGGSGANMASSVTSTKSASGSAVEFTDVPDWAKRITITFSSVNTSSNNLVTLQFGSSASYVTTGYTSSYGLIVNGSVGMVSQSTSGIALNTNTSTNDINYGTVTILIAGSNILTASGITGTSNQNFLGHVSGKVNISSTLTRLRITTSTSFTTGTITVLYESGGSATEGTITNCTLLGLLNNDGGTIRGGILRNNTLAGTTQNSGAIQNGTLTNSTLEGTLRNNSTLQGDLVVSDTSNNQLLKITSRNSALLSSRKVAELYLGYNENTSGSTITDNASIFLAGGYGDPNYSECVIESRKYGSSEESELLLFKGNDPNVGNGPDQIRLRAAKIVMDTYDGVTQNRTATNPRLTVESNGEVIIGPGTSSALSIRTGIRANNAATGYVQYEIPGQGTHYFWDNVEVSNRLTVGGGLVIGDSSRGNGLSTLSHMVFGKLTGNTNDRGTISFNYTFPSVPIVVVTLVDIPNNNSYVYSVFLHTVSTTGAQFIKKRTNNPSNNTLGVSENINWIAFCP